ncbi:MAG: 5-formyltetrahydrofolate cyclo-ligase [Mediterranea sp.]|jgi:5-formyltetrahydrofolate cyclo-ligase|nr:5-formyltetrahydrofolate cyclo-ligase [Mediterranea sp.]
MKERKNELRRQIARRKACQSAATLRSLSLDILETLENHPVFRSSNTVLLYHSMEDEVYTHAFIEKWSKRKHILLPVVQGDELEIRSYRNPDDMAVGTYGIKEPTGTAFHDYTQIDLAIVPGVAFDTSGSRLGRGKGYYDKLLPELTAYKIGICFPFQLMDKIPAEEFDVRMDEVIFNKKQY